MILPSNISKKILWSGFLFFLAGLCEIGGGYLVWLWLREVGVIIIYYTPRKGEKGIWTDR